MAILDIVKYPKPILLEIAIRVQPDGIEKEQQFIRDMMNTLLDKGGLGLAAPQVNMKKRIIIFRYDKSDIQVLINPVITSTKGKMVSEREGCLSIPNIRRNIKRDRVIVVEGFDRAGNYIKIKPKKNITSFVIQHEIDHLNGITILDGPKKRNLFKQKKGKEAR